jgi:hypothetical protein
MTVVRKANQMADGQISPKVAIPALAQLGAGLIFVVLGALPSIVKDGDTRSTLLTLGLALLGGSGLTGGLGFAAKPGSVVVQE